MCVLRQFSKKYNKMRFNYLLWLLCFLYISKSFGEEEDKKPLSKFQVRFLEASSSFNFQPSKRGYFEKHLNTYCYSGEKKTVQRILETLELQLEIEGDDYIQYDGRTPTEVEEHYTQHRSLFSLNLFSHKQRRLSLTPFEQQCIGIETVQTPYTVTLYHQHIDYYRLIQLLCGIVIFLFAGYLSTNALFFYIIGIIIGICSSFVLLIWLSGKLMPKRTMMYGVLIGGWSIGFYVVRMLWDNLQMILITYRNYVIWYIAITGLISFIFCYHWGPPKNQRSKNLIKWLLQLMSLGLVYYSSHFKEAMIAIICMVITLYYFPRMTASMMNFKNKQYQTEVKENTAAREYIPKTLRDNCDKWRCLASPKNTNLRMKNSLSPSLSSSATKKLSRKNSLHVEAGTPQRIATLDISNEDENENLSGSDRSVGENDLRTRKLYPLPDGSFILSESRPILIRPEESSPIYHRSSPMVATTVFDYDQNPENMVLQRKTLIKYTRRSCGGALSGAASTSDLLLSGRRGTPPPSSNTHLRSSSAQRVVQSRSARMILAAKRYHGSNPIIKVQPAHSDNESED